MGTTRLMRCDLHVHSDRSGAATLPLLGPVVQECYSPPQEVHRAARARGMDLVTLTDHDTIDGAMEIAGRPDTFVSEEVTCSLPGGRELHLGVFDLDARQHAEIARRRGDPESLFAYCAEQRLPVAANHLFSSLTGRRQTDDLRLALQRATMVEVRNGMVSRACNAAAARAARRHVRPTCGGSDAHTLASVARAFTCVAARDRAEFLAGLRKGLTIPSGRSGSYARLTADIARLVARTCAVQWTRSRWEGAALGALSVLLAPIVPLATLAFWARERAFAALHEARFRQHAALPPPAWLAAGTR